ncbi:MAG: hypothetical protein R3E99_03615 [Burkholderiaceae bacterium]
MSYLKSIEAGNRSLLDEMGDEAPGSGLVGSLGLASALLLIQDQISQGGGGTSLSVARLALDALKLDLLNLEPALTSLAPVPLRVLLDMHADAVSAMPWSGLLGEAHALSDDILGAIAAQDIPLSALGLESLPVLQDDLLTMDTPLLTAMEQMEGASTLEVLGAQSPVDAFLEQALQEVADHPGAPMDAFQSHDLNAGGLDTGDVASTWDDLGDPLAGVGGDTSDPGDTLTDGAGTLTDSLLTDPPDLIGEVVDSAPEVIDTVVESVVDPVLDTVVDTVVDPVVDTVVDTVDLAGDLLGDLLTDPSQLPETLASATSDVLQTTEETAGSLVDLVDSTVTSTTDTLVDVVDGTGDLLTGTAEVLGDAVDLGSTVLPLVQPDSGDGGGLLSGGLLG